MCGILEGELKAAEGGRAVQWSKVESCLFCLKAVLYDIPVTEVTVVPQIISLVLGMPDMLGLKHTIMSLYGTHSLIYLLTHLLTHSPTYSLTHSLTYSLTYSPTHLLTH